MPGKYDAIFEQLTPTQNCIVLDDEKTSNSVAQSLEDWAKKKGLKGCKVKTTKAYPGDKKPRVWLVFPEPPKTQIRGNFPKEAA